MADVASSTSALTDAISILNAETDSLVVKFGQISNESKLWNIASRILSGSGLWKLQNRIRAVGNVINVFNEANNKMLKSQLEQTEAAQKMGKTMTGLKYDLENVTKSEYYQAVMKGKIAQGYSDIAAAKEAEQEITEQYSKTITALEEKMGGGGKAGVMEFLKGDKGMVQELEKDKETGEYKNKMVEAKGPFGFTRNKFTRMFQKLKMARDIHKQTTWAAKGKKVREWMGKKLTKLGRLIDVGLSFFLKVMLFIMGATLVMMILRKMWPRFKKFLDGMGGIGNEMRIIKERLSEMLDGIWTILKGIFEGDFGKVWEGMRTVFLSVFVILVAAVVALGKIVVAALRALGASIIAGIKAKLPKFLGGGARGLLAGSDGIALVGEEGPELVSLPAGARVHSNATSRGMGGNTIHVHVNGRVGASDMEIRDIAQKVAREIGIRMNRTTSATGGF
jgi:hypothetical protein